jgi:uncharacterized membrane protein YedE/YeeE
MKKGDTYINPYLGGLLLGLVLFAAFLITGTGLGASGALSHIQTALLDFFAPHRVDTVGYFAKMAGGQRSPLMNPQVFMLVGVILGGLISGFFSKRLKVETRKGPLISNRQRWLLAFIGGALMGYGARMARGCTSGQALSGGAVLSVGSWAFMFSIFISAYALAYFLRRLWINPGADGGSHGSL